jgi:uncharacterized protein YndB with AHSA1/START domain
MKKLEQVYEIKAPIGEVWQALVDPEVISDWGGGPAEMDDQVGTKWKLWGGDIYGQNLKVTPSKKLVQNWYSGEWPEPSVCTFELSEESGVTTIKLSHVDIPDNEFDGVESGWTEYYLGPLKELLEQS